MSVQSVCIALWGCCEMAILKVRDEQGVVHELLAIRGEKGKDAQVDYTGVANALKGSKTGNPVVIKDASPLYQEMTLKSDVGGATVTVYGKNLLDLSQVTVGRCIRNEANTHVVSDISESYYCYLSLTYLNDLILACRGKSFTFSVKQENEKAGTTVVIYGTRTDGRQFQSVEYLGRSVATVTVDDEFTAVDRVVLRFNQFATAHTDQTSVIGEFQLELGSAATEYEPYREPWTVTGSDEGAYPPIAIEDGQGMTLFADDGTLTAAYNRDLNRVIAAIEEAIS